MTDLVHLAIALWVATILTGIVILRKALAEARTPSPCERDAQDGRGEAGEGFGPEFLNCNHNGANSHDR